MTTIDVVDEFFEIIQKYYKSGFYIVDIKVVPNDVDFHPGKISYSDNPDFIGYKSYDVNEHNLSYEYNGHNVVCGKIYKPVKKYYCADFESLFGFGGCCSEFTENKFIYMFPKHMQFNKVEVINFLEGAELDQQMLNFLLWLSMHGGYCNNVRAIFDINEKLSGIIGCEPIENPEKFAMKYL